ncbi:3-phosphoserine/phosphohydroxythreonine transaminase [Pseudanabaena sp. PCC 6802]|uniref:3-phosphoserine/phosphohydroxythreonine transaminase n=1 Tax=Pseudanabaena sp. PCC 6802 TaxID=118173 RepID=UPI0003451042|nr:3-phosphoserine/phosphohydroxythreonine transaminase [Pseudanabaena sp. PCC 6802]
MITLQKTTSTFNFSPGPGALPLVVLEETRQALERLPNVPLSILGIGHRSPWFDEILNEAESNLRSLLNIPTSYKILFLQGGSSLQFSMVPMNLLRGSNRTADYIVSGYWSAKSVPDAQREGNVRIAWDGSADGFMRLPNRSELNLTPDAAYLHYISNETVEGLQFNSIPGLPNIPLVCDMSSDFLSRPFDINRYALVYAHAQKNLGPSGVTVVILHEDLLANIPDNLHTMLDYRPHVLKRSNYNTPPVFSIYVMMLVTRWMLREIASLDEMHDLNKQKAERLYQSIDESEGFYRGRAAIQNRSLMNVVFNMASPQLEAEFAQEAQANGIFGLAGHRTLGGLRASLYNAVTLEAVDALCRFMYRFHRRHR